MAQRMTARLKKGKGGVSTMEMDLPPFFDTPNYNLPKYEVPKVDFSKLQPINKLIADLEVVLTGKDWNDAWTALSAVQAKLSLIAGGGTSVIIPPKTRI